MILDDILARTRTDVAQRKAARPLSEIEKSLPAGAADRSLARALRPAQAPAAGITCVAEFKRRSPSAGWIREGARPEEIVGLYAAAGAAALSVLTDEPFFGGTLADLTAARATVAVPTMRKDFIVDAYQLAEARAAGADAALLIVAALSDAELSALLAVAALYGLETLVEAHDAEEAARAVRAGAPIIGINNRDLRTFTVDRDLALRLRAQIPQERIVVAESGIRDAADVARLRDAGVDAMLVGEALMRASDPEAALARAARARVMTDVIVKICGLTTPEDAALAVAAGADAVGVNLWPSSKRYVDDATARAVLAVVPAGVLKVGVFVNAPAADVAARVAALGLDRAQLHGDETPEAFAGVDAARLIRVVRVRDEASFAAAAGWRVPLYMYDAHVAGYGGGGVTAPWALVSDRARRPFWLAGGLTPENVGAAIAAVRPDGVDVASGVESAPGRKDPTRVRAFIEAARAAARTL